MASKAISELEAVSKIQDDDLLLLSMANNSKFETKKITGDNLKSTILSGVQLEQTVKEGTELATLDVDGKAIPIYMPAVDKGDSLYPLVDEEKGTQIARVVRDDGVTTDFYLYAPTTDFSSNMGEGEGILLGTLVADGITNEIRCPSGIGQADVQESCERAIDVKLEYLPDTSQVRINDKLFKVINLDSSGLNQAVEDACSDAISDTVSFDEDTSTLTIGDDSLKVPNIDSEELKDLMDDSISGKMGDIQSAVEKGVTTELSVNSETNNYTVGDNTIYVSKLTTDDLFGAIIAKIAVNSSTNKLRVGTTSIYVSKLTADDIKSAITDKISVNSETNNYTVGDNTIYVSKLTADDIKSAITDKISTNSSTNDLTVNGTSVHIPKLSEIGSGSSYPYIDSTKFATGTFYKGTLKGMTLNTNPTSYVEYKSVDPSQTSNNYFKLVFVSNYYVKLNIHKTTCAHPAFWGFLNSDGTRYEFGRVAASTDAYMTWEGYVKQGCIMFFSIHTAYEGDGDSILMYPVS